MRQKLFNILKKHGIDLVSSIKLKDCSITRPYKLQKAGFCEDRELSAVIFAVPYLTEHKERNISAYAVFRDYHAYFAELFAALLGELNTLFPEYRFAGFADDSPIDERLAAARAGLGIPGDNGMLITEKYSSYVFLGEIITDMPIETTLCDIRHCEGCGKCSRVCPKKENGVCLSALTQKKGELTEEETAIIKKHGSAWGCDLCQEVCPHTQKAKKAGTLYSTIPFFSENIFPVLTSSLIDGMSDEEFALRAYSWRKRETISRNLRILESMNPQNNDTKDNELC